MLWETIERVNRLRQKALQDPEFIQSAKAHERAIQHQADCCCVEKRKRSHKAKAKTLADVYKQVEFSDQYDDRHH
ncbi:hypothetical protein [Vibrio japonicus]|uniref:Uncharacterized protein n=1 Tax=Vibrio japonicus TaxID=1824638 RepID=A0ABY5LLV4_9VIBR|nr:hypothetical protein [Vibrio japonicus]UUM31654.1 hypothetical protein NP165_05835 [Vibrio japonicus]